MRQDIQSILDHIDTWLRDEQVDLNQLRRQLIDYCNTIRHIDKDRMELMEDISRLRQNAYKKLVAQLHDTPLHHLSIVIKLMQTKLRDYEIESFSRQEVEFLVRDVEREIESIRNMVFNGRHEVVDGGQDLIVLLREIIRGENVACDVSLEITADEESLNTITGKATKIVLPFVEETIRNAQGHGNARKVKIYISNDENTLRVKTIDDGIGFQIPPPDNSEAFQNLADNGHLGLSVLAQLAASCRGAVWCSSSQSELGGAEVVLELKLHP